jgi:Plasma-membrane choline transporter
LDVDTYSRLKSKSFEDADMDEPIMTDQTWFHFKTVVATSFGTIAFASFITGIVRTIQWLLYQYRHYTHESYQLRNGRRRGFGSGNLGRRAAAEVATGCVNTLAKIVDSFSQYTLVYVGLTGSALLPAAYACTRLFRRNLVIGLSVQGLLMMINVIGRIAVSILSGMIAFWTCTASLSGEQHGSEWVVAGIAAMIPYYVLGIVTSVVQNT